VKGSPSSGEPTTVPGSTAFCPACWERVPEARVVCPACGVEIARYLAETDYSAQLIYAAKYLDARRRLIAIWLLGERREKRAIPVLHRLTLTAKWDVHLAKAAVDALAKIGGAEARHSIELARGHHPSRFVRRAAAQVLRVSFQ